MTMLYLDFRNTVDTRACDLDDLGAGCFSNVKLIQPGYAADTTQVYTNAT